jgi:hypothetical protein
MNLVQLHSQSDLTIFLLLTLQVVGHSTGYISNIGKRQSEAVRLR